MKVVSAVRSRVRGVSVGITKDDKVIAFYSKDYDNRGNVKGKYSNMQFIRGVGAFYLSYCNYDKQTLNKLGYSSNDLIKVNNFLNKMEEK
jgi:hypothetical protein